MLEFLVRAYNDTHRRIQYIKFEESNFLHSTIISLYATIIEQTDSAILLLSKNKLPAAQILLRSTLEAFIDLINLVDDPDYIDQMRASYHKEWLKLSTAGTTGDDPFLEPYKSEELTLAIAHQQESMDALKARGIKPMLIEDKFTKAGMLGIYKSVYNLLCAVSHNNIRALVSHHVKLTGKKIDVVIFQDIDAGDFLATSRSFASIYLDAGLVVHEHFGSREAEALLHYRNQLYAMSPEEA